MKKPGSRSLTATNGIDNPVDIEKVFRDGVLIERALRKATRRAALEHKRAGVPMAIQENGHTKLISADEFLHPKKSARKKRPSRR